MEGLKSYLKKDYEKLVAVDLVCHACPSPLVYRKFVDLQSVKCHKNPANVKFRDKVYGYKYSAMTIYDVNDNLTDDSKPFYKEGIDTDVMLRSFFANISPRPSCFACAFKKQYRVTDFTIWDCFDVDKFSSELDNDKGVTRALLHSSKAFGIWDQVKSMGLNIEIPVEKAVEGVREMFHSVPMNPRRQQFFADLNSMPAEQVFQKYFPVTIRHRLEKQARLWSNRLGIYKVMKKIFKKLHGKGEIKR